MAIKVAIKIAIKVHKKEEDSISLSIVAIL